jgi:hypothetical protein
MMAKSDATPYFSILSSQAAALLENGDKQEARSLSWPEENARFFFALGQKILFQHGVIPGSSQTKAQGISSPGTYEAILVWPLNDGERQWNIMLDWTCR